MFIYVHVGTHAHFFTVLHAHVHVSHSFFLLFSSDRQGLPPARVELLVRPLEPMGRGGQVGQGDAVRGAVGPAIPGELFGPADLEPHTSAPEMHSASSGEAPKLQCRACVIGEAGK